MSGDDEEERQACEQCGEVERDALTDKNRSRAAQAAADDRKARGIRPAFLKGEQARAVSEALLAREDDDS